MCYCLEGDIMPKVRVTKDDILNISFDMVRINGIDNLNARRIAKELNCSVQPIFFNFSGINAVLNKSSYSTGIYNELV